MDFSLLAPISDPCKHAEAGKEMRAGRSSYTGVGAVWNLQVSKLVLS